MTGQSTTPTAGNGEGRNDQVGAGSLTSLPPTPDTTRCRICGHPLEHPRSVRRGVGPVCAHRLAEAVAAVAGERVAVVVTVDGADVLARITPPGVTR